MSSADTYEVYAIKYGTMQNRFRHDNFISPDPHEGRMPIDYFVWAIVNKQRTIVVDTGFDFKEGKRRGREVNRLPAEGLKMLGIDAGKVADVVITHMHYDHAGTLDDFPKARFHIQEPELAFVTGPNMLHAPLRHSFTVDHVCTLVRRLFEGRVAFRAQDDEIAPGVTVHHIGGHTPGIQCVRVRTKRGWVVLASDTTHFYENIEKVSPFPVLYNLGDMIRGYDRLRKLADSPKHIVPGHDPLVLKRYPAPKKNLEGLIVRLDVNPKK